MFIRTVAESKNSAMHYVRGNAQRSSDQLHVRTERWIRGLDLAYGFLNLVIVQCDKEMSIIDVCRKLACERKARTVLRFAQKKRVTRATGLSKRYTDTYRDSHDAARHKSRRTLAHSFQQSHLPSHLQFITLDVCYQESQCQNAIPVFAWSPCMFHLCACSVNRYLR